MASRVIHYAVADKIVGLCGIEDRARFILGTLLPDAYADGMGTSAAHLKKKLPDGRRTYDLEKFRKLFGNELKTDVLYLGYYLHLIQDLAFRKFVYGKYHWNPLLPGNVERLHNDYALTNSYVVQKYCLGNDLDVPADFKAERIFELYSFDAERLKVDFSEDFTREASGEIFFFTLEMADEFISLAVEISAREIEALRRGEIYTDMYASAWG